ncbi:MAG: type IV-A pilus assembly ATPase PilB [Proteobacteria bacterium]|nr:type IV-A pilus assembly ATPase PilB [Pseudomonadota bacterium]
MGGLARRLVTDKLLDESQVAAAISLAARDNIPFVAQLVSSNQISERSIAVVAAQEFGIPVLDLDAFDPKFFPTELVDNKLLKKHNVLPLYQHSNKLYIAVADPANSTALDEIKFHTGMPVEPVVVEQDKLSRIIGKLLTSSKYALEPATRVGASLAQTIDLGADLESALHNPSEEAPIVGFVNNLLQDAIRKVASDIHIEPYEKAYRIRFRVDGILQEVNRPPISMANRIASRLKIMSQMDISERRIPQDGRIKLKLSSTRAIDFRGNTLPTLWGEKIVLRLLDPASTRLGIDELGYEDCQKQLYLGALRLNQGLILVTGPTGSGKTVSLYTGLNILNTAERNISAAEDPVEINLEGINQLAVNNKIGLNFAAALRAFLRQDPDVVMVGEIRDLETAEIAIRAAQTGHLVLSTLHTTSASETITRLQNMGIPAFNLATSLSLIIAQRLIRRLCNLCKESVEIPEKVLREEGFTSKLLSGAQLYQAVGCKHCSDGYKGRIGIYEVVPITDSLSRIIMAGGNSIQIADQSQAEGFHNLRHSALCKVARSLTSLEEANRLT